MSVVGFHGGFAGVSSTLFVFVCKNSSCHSRQPPQRPAFKVWRSQLARENEFYSFAPPDYGTRSQ